MKVMRFRCVVGRRAKVVTVRMGFSVLGELESLLSFASWTATRRSGAERLLRA